MPELVLRPDRVAAGGEAIARDDDGRVVFVRGALPGELVRVAVSTERKDWARGDAVEVLEPSPDRVVPPCPSRRAGCGGCGWQHVALDAQRELRVAVVVDALRRIGGVGEPLVERGGGVGPWDYRTSVRVAPDPDGRAGFRVEGSHDVVAAPDCLIAHPALSELLPQLELRGDVELSLRVSAATGRLNARWDPTTGSVAGLPADVDTGRDASIEEDVGGVRLRVSMRSFFQSGPAAAELLVDTVRRAAPELASASAIVDAYAGVGLFARCLVEGSTRVVAIETSRAAIADARHNLHDRPAEIVKSEVGGWRVPADLDVDVVVADPARTGLGRPGVNALTATKAPALVLVSCDPASLGRDVRLLREAGYGHERSEVIDTFPHTTHVEVVSRFTRPGERR